MTGFVQLIARLTRCKAQLVAGPHPILPGAYDPAPPAPGEPPPGECCTSTIERARELAQRGAPVVYVRSPGAQS